VIVTEHRRSQPRPVFPIPTSHKTAMDQSGRGVGDTATRSPPRPWTTSMRSRTRAEPGTPGQHDDLRHRHGRLPGPRARERSGAATASRHVIPRNGRNRCRTALGSSGPGGTAGHRRTGHVPSTRKHSPVDPHGRLLDQNARGRQPWPAQASGAAPSRTAGPTENLSSQRRRRAWWTSSGTVILVNTVPDRGSLAGSACLTDSPRTALSSLPRLGRATSPGARHGCAGRPRA
jgi:hypothetical protein